MDFLNFTDDDDSQPQPSAPLTNIDEGTRQDTSLDATFEEVHQLGPADEIDVKGTVHYYYELAGHPGEMTFEWSIPPQDLQIRRSTSFRSPLLVASNFHFYFKLECSRSREMAELRVISNSSKATDITFNMFVPQCGINSPEKSHRIEPKKSVSLSSLDLYHRCTGASHYKTQQSLIVYLVVKSVHFPSAKKTTKFVPYFIRSDKTSAPPKVMLQIAAPPYRHTYTHENTGMRIAHREYCVKIAMAKVSLEHGFMLSSMQHLGGINQDLQDVQVKVAEVLRIETDLLMTVDDILKLMTCEDLVTAKDQLTWLANGHNASVTILETKSLRKDRKKLAYSQIADKTSTTGKEALKVYESARKDYHESVKSLAGSRPNPEPFLEVIGRIKKKMKDLQNRLSENDAWKKGQPRYFEDLDESEAKPNKGEEAEVVITKSLGQLLRHVAEWRSTYDVRLCQLNNIPTEKLVPEVDLEFERNYQNMTSQEKMEHIDKIGDFYEKIKELRRDPPKHVPHRHIARLLEEFDACLSDLEDRLISVSRILESHLVKLNPGIPTEKLGRKGPNLPKLRNIAKLSWLSSPKKR